jgi:hypothetical protein
MLQSGLWWWWGGVGGGQRLPWAAHQGINYRPGAALAVTRNVAPRVFEWRRGVPDGPDGAVSASRPALGDSATAPSERALGRGTLFLSRSCVLRPLFVRWYSTLPSRRGSLILKCP